LRRGNLYNMHNFKPFRFLYFIPIIDCPSFLYLWRRDEASKAAIAPRLLNVSSGGQVHGNDAISDRRGTIHWKGLD